MGKLTAYGPFVLLQSIIAFFILIHSIKKIRELYFLKNNTITPEKGNSVNVILFWSGFIVMIGFLGAFLSSYTYLVIVAETSGSYDPRVTMGAFVVSLQSIIFGLTLFTFFSIVWFILWSRYNKRLNAQM